MNPDSKVTTQHLQRGAYLYVRQSTLRQVLENGESTQRQYALRQKAVSLGWKEEQLVVIDHDQGHSGASAVDREGFQRLVADVGLGKAGIVMGLEVSRLARNCADWHRLLEICALSETLILDEDGLYHPGHFNDRLLLGLKGTMSEAELHVLKARLIGGRLSKAQRGELKVLLPIGLMYDELDRVILDPDQQVQNTLRLFFQSFERIGSAWKTVQEFGRLGLKFPARRPRGSGELIWQELNLSHALATLHNPRYAGVFCYGRTHTWQGVEGVQHSRKLAQEQWRFFKADAHPGYISWEQFQANQQRLRDNFQSHGGGQHRTCGPAREGTGLLQGIVLCGRCGHSMNLRYSSPRKGRLRVNYTCERASVDSAHPVCQRIPGTGIDEAVSQILIESISPLTLEVALGVQDELQTRIAEADRVRRQHVERAEYEAGQARLRYMRVDPNNRLVADTLEVQWNEKLRLLAAAKEEYEQRSERDRGEITTEQKARILSLVDDFPRLWRAPQTENRDRKRMLRLVIEDVTLRREAQEILIQIRFRGGALRELRIPMPKPAWALRQTPREIIQQIDQLLGEHTDRGVARVLNERGLRSGSGKEFTAGMIKHLRFDHGLKTFQQRLCDKGWLTIREVGELLGEAPRHVYRWRQPGLLVGVLCGEGKEMIYQRPPDTVVAEIRRRIRPWARKPRANAQAAPSTTV
jgi:DNA invertase Pin-like site-specific DNA recombinase